MSFSDLARFSTRIVVDEFTGCWLWTGYVNPQNGYGYQGSVSAHRWAYALFVGEVPDGLQIDHLCRVRPCVNPDHLEAVTSAENTRRGDNLASRRAAAALITHCPQGHPYDEANTYHYSEHGRACRACKRDAARRSRGKAA